MKELKDYLHLYLGVKGYFMSKYIFNYFDDGLYILTGRLLDIILAHSEPYHETEFMPILRRLSDMTEEEEEEYTSLIDSWNFGFRRNMLGAASATKYLISKHFDLFNLIEAGLAIDATTPTTEIKCFENKKSK